MVKIVTISDLHTGHSRTTSSILANNIKQWLVEYHAIIKTADIFIIPGDFWDKLVNTLTDDVGYGLYIMANLFSLCSKYNIPLRLLEGTRSHEWGQSSMFDILAEGYPTLDFKYVTHIYIEKMDDIDKTILYVPDDLAERRSMVEDMVSKYMVNYGIEKVDIAVLHTQFKHQLPKIDNIDFSSTEFYQSITNDLVLSGHLHDYCKEGIFVTPGSFERCAHGEEGPKGGCLITLDKELTVKRLINKHATLYKTFNVTDYDKALKDIAKRLKPYNGIGYVRLSGKDEVLKNRLLDTLKDMYPSITFSIKKSKKKVVKSVKSLVKDVIRLNKDSLLNEITKSITEYCTEKSDVERIIQRFKVVSNECA